MSTVSEQIAAALLGDRSASQQLKPESTDLKGEVEESSFALTSDRLFRETVQKMIVRLMVYLSYQYLKFVLVAVFVGVVYSKGIDYDPNLPAWIVVLVGTVISAVPNKQVFLVRIRNKKIQPEIALMTGHMVIPDLSGNSKTEVVYNATAKRAAQPDSFDKYLLRRELKKRIMLYLTTRNPLLKKMAILGELCMITSIIMFIVSLAKDDLPGDTQWAVILFIVLECIARIKYILLLAVIALVLAVLIVLGLFVCCLLCICRKSKAIEQFIQSQPVRKYNIQTDLLKQVDCSICHLDFSNDENIIALPCDETHIFHEFCINQRLKLWTTCPICRYDFKGE